MIPGLALAVLPVAACDVLLRRRSGQGIHDLTSAGEPARARAVLAGWGPGGARLARVSLRADFSLALAYGAGLARWVAETNSETRSTDRLARAAVLLPVSAALADAVEGVATLRALGRDLDDRAALRVARAAGQVKFGAFGLAVAHIVGRRTLRAVGR